MRCARRSRAGRPGTSPTGSACCRRPSDGRCRRSTPSPGASMTSATTGPPRGRRSSCSSARCAPSCGRRAATATRSGSPSRTPLVATRCPWRRSATWCRAWRWTSSAGPTRRSTSSSTTAGTSPGRSAGCPWASSAPATPLADALGVALQLTNILRDVREDLADGRVYLPAEDLAAAGVELVPGDTAGLAPAAGPLADLLRAEAPRASDWYDEGLRLLPLLSGRSAACCAAMAGIYQRLLVRIAARPEEVLHRRLSLPAWEKALVSAQALAAARR
jgi:hypothetical protein